MNDDFEGRNLPELLALMHDIVVPAAPGWRPETAGWLILLGWLAGVGLIGAWHWRARRQRNRYRREAEAELDAIIAANDADSAPRIADLLKRTALSAFGRERVASMHGPAWAAFLAHTANDDPSVIDVADLLASAAYRPDVDGRALAPAARRWIRSHRV